ncbi:hypothetical protein GCM10010218_10670 [Streptomyces mashuensis]|uniref:Carrier domain-containing protein n=1 Tax=Streptomyces mashuensis TaxID=33904 RepID=A0A919AZP1_9ACTN|nr:phosphopantetheine-binding protein [Streptomyces mashuensis]GHF31668.1 hypothetical protein GCM10010218_10670 [Streptomyces mashuensis]
MTETTHTVVEPAEAERLIVGWAAEILEEPETTAGDNFLDLGGHSMLALELNQRVLEKFGVEFDMQVLFERSLGEVAAHVAERSVPTESPRQSG